MNKKKLTTIIWIAALAAVVVLCGLFYVLRGNGQAVQALVYVDGELYDTIDLSAVAVPYTVTVETEYGYNTLRVSHGAIAVSEADCSEQICVNQGEIRDGLIPITCLPHHLVIEIEGADE